MQYNNTLFIQNIWKETIQQKQHSDVLTDFSQCESGSGFSVFN